MLKLSAYGRVLAYSAEASEILLHCLRSEDQHTGFTVLCKCLICTAFEHLFMCFVHLLSNVL